jgi:hypothetical protein
MNNNNNNNSNSNSKNLSDQMLTERLLNLTASERHTTLELLLSLAEFDDRKLFATTHSSLFSYATQQLKMSEGEAQRRIDGARLLRSFPEFIKQYDAGELNLTHASLLRRHFRTEARIQKKNLSRENQFELVQKLLGKPTRESERILVDVSSRPDLQKPTRPGKKLLKNGNYRVQFEARPELIAKSERLKEIWSHSMSGATWPEIIERAFDLAIEKSDPYAKAERNHIRLQKKERQQRHQPKQMQRQPPGQGQEQVQQKLHRNIEHQKQQRRAEKAHHCEKPNIGTGEIFDVDSITGEIQLRLPLSVNETQSEINPQLAPTVATVAKAATTDLFVNFGKYSRTTIMPLELSKNSPSIPLATKWRSRTIPSVIRHAVWLRDHGQCTFVYPNGQNCGERMGLEIDHITAFAHGGDHASANLRLRCQQHNAYHCVQTFGRAGAAVRTGQ